MGAVQYVRCPKCENSIGRGSNIRPNYLQIGVGSVTAQLLSCPYCHTVLGVLAVPETS